MNTNKNKIISGLSLAFSALVLSAILAFLVYLIILFPTISSASADELSTTTQYSYAKNVPSDTSYTINFLCAAKQNTLTATPPTLPKSLSATTTSTAANDEIVYGLIGENVLLYNTDMQPITELPATYFVIILSENENHYEVSYRDLSGYVEKIRIFKINYEPRLKFGLAYFSAQNDTHPVIIREKPTSTSPQLGTLPDREKAMYYGGITGEALIPAAGTLWYFVNHEGIYGYVYSAQGSAESFAVNPGDKVVTPTAESPDPTKDGEGFPDWAFILLLSVPAIIIMLALFGRGKSQPSDPQQVG